MKRSMGSILFQISKILSSKYIAPVTIHVSFTLGSRPWAITFIVRLRVYKIVEIMYDIVSVHRRLRPVERYLSGSKLYNNFNFRFAPGKEARF
jgi:hypothetical protein